MSPSQDTAVRSLLEITEIMEAARSAYIDNLQANVTTQLQTAYTQLLSVNGQLLQELEKGSIELSIYRRLLYALQTNQLTKEAYGDLIEELQAHKTITMSTVTPHSTQAPTQGN